MKTVQDLWNEVGLRINDGNAPFEVMVSHPNSDRLRRVARFRWDAGNRRLVISSGEPTTGAST